MNRRSLIKMLGAGAVFGLAGTTATASRSDTTKSKNIPMIHATDLYRPHVDPDDHWDLACVFALAYRGDIDLKAVLIDFPPPRRRDVDPDVLAISQMNFVTGNKVPVVVGSSIAMRSPDDSQPDAPLSDRNGVSTVLNVLKNSTKPVVINITGSSRDIAVAGNQEPELFAKKCMGIYLNAGTGSREKQGPQRSEYNVTLDPLAYSAIFKLPCPVYWMPCFEKIEPQSERHVMEHGTYYRFQQNDILPYLSDKMQKFVAYMLAKVTDNDWLSYLLEEKDQALLHEFGTRYRNMWCTGGFFHAAGYTVTSEGRIMPLDQAPNKAVFAFEPANITCTEKGVTTWLHNSTARNRYIFHVLDTENYQSAMTKAMKKLLMELP